MLDNELKSIAFPCISTGMTIFSDAGCELLEKSPLGKCRGEKEDMIISKC
jgi:O-acetyl-ADP-ribose deacetylase (regulator of RNase III)